MVCIQPPKRNVMVNVIFVKKFGRADTYVWPTGTSKFAVL